jgi:hypothetical protein
MSEIKYPCSPTDTVDRFHHRIGGRGTKTNYGLRHSSLWPWILAVAISLMLWVSLAGAMWELIG